MARFKSPLIVEVRSAGELIGTLSPEQFMRYCDRPAKFLEELVTMFNEMKARLGEPERVSLALAKGGA